MHAVAILPRSAPIPLLLPAIMAVAAGMPCATLRAADPVVEIKVKPDWDNSHEATPAFTLKRNTLYKFISESSPREADKRTLWDFTEGADLADFQGKSFVERAVLFKTKDKPGKLILMQQYWWDEQPAYAKSWTLTIR